MNIHMRSIFETLDLRHKSIKLTFSSALKLTYPVLKSRYQKQLSYLTLMIEISVQSVCSEGTINKSDVNFNGILMVSLGNGSNCFRDEENPES